MSRLRELRRLRLNNEAPDSYRENFLNSEALNF